MSGGPYVNGIAHDDDEEGLMAQDGIDLVEVLQRQAKSSALTERHLDEMRRTTSESHQLHKENAQTLGTINNHLGELVAIERSKALHRAELERQRQAAAFDAQKDRRKLMGQVVMGVLGILTTFATAYAAFTWGSQGMASPPPAIEAPAARAP